MFSSSEGAKAASILLSNLEGFKNNITEMIDSTGAAEKAAETMMDTTAEKTQIAKNQIDNLISAIAEQLLPVIGETAQSISDALDSSGIQEIAQAVGSFISGTLTLLLKNIKLIASAVSGVTAGFIAFKTAALLTKVISSWQTAALQVKMLGTAQNFAAVKTAALNGQLTTQEMIYAVLNGRLDLATVKQAALNTVMKMNPAVLVATGIGLLATALTGFALSASSASEETRSFTDELDDMQKTYDDAISSGEAELAILEKKVNRYEELRNQINKTADETAELKNLAGDLQKTFGDSVTVVDSLTGSYNSLTDAYKDYAAALRKNIMIEAMKSRAEEAASLLLDLQDEYDSLSYKIENYVGKPNMLDPNSSNGMIRNPDGSIPEGLEDSAEVKQWKQRKSEIERDMESARKIVDDYINAVAEFGTERRRLVLPSLTDGYI